MALTDCVFMTREMFVINVMDVTCPSYFHCNGWLENTGGSLLFEIPSKTFGALKYFDSYRFASRMGSYAVLTSLAYHR